MEEPHKHLRGIEMSREEVDQFLTEKGVGILCLASGNDAYGLPLSFGYDGNSSLYFVFLQFGDESQKIDFSGDTNESCFVVYSAETKYLWKSVLVKGRLTELPEDQQSQVEEIMNDNAWFPSLFPFGEPIKKTVRYKMEITEVTGQKGHGYE